jgi:hypothetical protein
MRNSACCQPSPSRVCRSHRPAHRTAGGNRETLEREGPGKVRKCPYHQRCGHPLHHPTRNPPFRSLLAAAVDAAATGRPRRGSDPAATAGQARGACSNTLARTVMAATELDIAECLAAAPLTGHQGADSNRHPRPTEKRLSAGVSVGCLQVWDKRYTLRRSARSWVLRFQRRTRKSAASTAVSMARMSS